MPQRLDSCVVSLSAADQLVCPLGILRPIAFLVALSTAYWIGLGVPYPNRATHSVDSARKDESFPLASLGVALSRDAREAYVLGPTSTQVEHRDSVGGI